MNSFSARFLSIDILPALSAVSSQKQKTRRTCVHAGFRLASGGDARDCSAFGLVLAFARTSLLLSLRFALCANLHRTLDEGLIKPPRHTRRLASGLACGAALRTPSFQPESSQKQKTRRTCVHAGFRLASGGDGGIRTLDSGLCPNAPLAGECLRPLGHVSERNELYMVFRFRGGLGPFGADQFWF